MTARTLYFTGSEEVKIDEEPIPEPATDEVCVRTALSAISPGTELLIYRGEAPTEMAIDETIDALSGSFEYPLTYGYSAVGVVSEVGAEVSNDWNDTPVFAFHPHESHFTATPDELIPLSENRSMETAALLANLECAVNFLLDGQPMIGEHVAVYGQGVVGLLTTALLSQYPLGSLVTVDLYERRRKLSAQFGADKTLDPNSVDVVEQLRDNHPGGTDIAYELTGNPDTLNDAIDGMAYDSRLIIGSWYGTNRASIDLGERFHRNRGQLVSSQVSSIAPEHSGRWSKSRRFDVARHQLNEIEPTNLITHRVPITRASEAYQLLDQRPHEAVQILLTYE